MNKRLAMIRAIAAGMCLCGTMPVLAATIFGSVFLRGDQPAADKKVTLSCDGTSAPATGQTDRRGTYRLSINGSGKCKFTVDDSKPADVVLFNQAPTQYDFILQGSGSSAQLVRR
jgi:hypothetical protein